jgi:UDP-N-acetylmuramate: L-alanyl-gamma-D-glutamyl-meso-diaminopimelate ligase
MTKKKAYFVGIAGRTMGQLAKAFQDMGWSVSGSDHRGVYPPISIYLRKNKIPYIEGYQAKNVPQDADLIVVGRSAMMVDKNNPEYLKAKTLKNTPVLSFPEVLQKYLVKDRSIVVAGTYGKTTIVALVSWILIKAGQDPSYMFSALPLNMEDGVKITNSNFSVVEGDEPPAMRETDPPKFMFYKPKYVLVTATHHDHPEIFKTKAEYLKVFQNFLNLIPPEGLIVYNLDNVDRSLIKKGSCQTVSYSLSNHRADYYVKDFIRRGKRTFFEIGGRSSFQLETVLLGRHNLENHCGAVALCSQLGIEKEVIAEAVKTFKGVKTRLEYLGEFSGRHFYWDLAQHPDKVRGTLEALKDRFPKKRIICVYDPATTGLKYKESLKWFDHTFDAAEEVILGRVSFLRQIPRQERVTGVDLVRAISRTQKKVFYLPQDKKIFEYLTGKTRPEEVIVFMSSGGLRFTNLIEKVVNFFKQ